MSIRLVDGAIDGFAQRVTLGHGGSDLHVQLPLVGDFQVAERAGRRRARDRDAAAIRQRVFAALANLKAPRAGSSWSATRNGAPIFVDYAHKPDALAKALEALRPYAQRQARRRVRLPAATATAASGR